MVTSLPPEGDCKDLGFESLRAHTPSIPPPHRKNRDVEEAFCALRAHTPSNRSFAMLNHTTPFGRGPKIRADRLAADDSRPPNRSAIYGEAVLIFQNLQMRGAWHSFPRKGDDIRFDETKETNTAERLRSNKNGKVQNFIIAQKFYINTMILLKGPSLMGLCTKGWFC